MENKEIDFVITWVDGNDENWQQEKSKYKSAKDNDNRKIRYRDYELLKYWFRAVEKYAPWVHKIYFITYGHLPKWLNTSNSKLVIVKHEDYIPKKYLPTFNSCTIELNMHRITGLSENFVYFNDDMFLNDNLKETDFFQKNLPCDYAILTAIVPSGSDKFEHRLINNMNFINKNFSMKEVIKKNPLKWFHYKYGLSQIRTLLLINFNNFPCLKFSHLPVSYNKSNFSKIWSMDEKLLNDSCVDKFRSFYGVNHWIIQDYQKVTGKFKPRKPNIGKFYILSENNSHLYDDIIHSKSKMICINDSEKVEDFERIKRELITVFEKKFKEKSSFEN